MKVKASCLMLFLFLFAGISPILAAPDDAVGLNAKVEELDKKIESMQKILSEIQNNQKVMLEQIIAEHQKTRKWISNR